MALEGRVYLEELMNSVICIADAFRIRVEDEKYIFSILTKEQQTNDYYAISTIYDTIVDLDRKIKFSFAEAVKCNLPETLEGYNPFTELNNSEFIALYHIENMIFRISTLWDLLAQICNVIYHTNLSIEKINYNRYFTRYSAGDDAIDIAKEIKVYLDEEEDMSADVNPWLGNHTFLNSYRNQMTHRVSPGITSISTLGSTLRPPTLYILHRATEDYYKVSSFLCRLINEFLIKHKDWLPIGLFKL